ncbi:MAG: OmpA family protein, partial [Pseudomonadota bacterium]
MKYIQIISRYTPFFAVLFALTACETANKEEQIVVAQPPVPSVVAPVAPQYGRFPDFDNQLPSVTKGAVTVYSLDGAPPAIVAPMHIGMTPAPSMATPIMKNDGSVTTYSLSSHLTTAMPKGDADEQIFFKNGSSRLGSIDKQKISAFADQAKFAPVNKITVEGHASRPTQVGTDSVEAHVLNLKESMNRSFAVSKTLMKDGVPAEKIKTMRHGSVNATGDDKYDRRVDMFM